MNNLLRNILVPAICVFFFFSCASSPQNENANYPYPEETTEADAENTDADAENTDASKPLEPQEIIQSEITAEPDGSPNEAAGSAVTAGSEEPATDAEPVEEEDTSVYEKTDITYCEDISVNLGRYSDIEEVYADLELKAFRKAVKQLLDKELKKIEPLISLNMEDIIDASRNLIRFEKIERSADGTLKPCVVLKNCYVSNKDKARFDRVEIANICTYGHSLRSEHDRQIRKGFIDAVRTANKHFKIMMNDPKQLKTKTINQLSWLIHREERESKAEEHMIATECKSFFVYPIEIYTASSERQLTPAVKLLPIVRTTDYRRRLAEFRFIVVDLNRYSWKHRSTQFVKDIQSSKVVKDFFQKFNCPEFKNVTNNFKELICLGMSECDSGIKTEYRRAKYRSLKLKEWITLANEGGKQLPIYGLIWNKNKKPGNNCRGLSKKEIEFRKKIVLIGVTKNSARGVNVMEALHRSLEKIEFDKTLPLRFEPHHRFEFVTH